MRNNVRLAVNKLNTRYVTIIYNYILFFKNYCGCGIILDKHEIFRLNYSMQATSAIGWHIRLL
jgi:hypothetical protein